MELYEYIRKYRELSSMTQTMFAEEIFNNTNGKIKPTIGVINGIERGGAITDKNLYDYLCQEFLFVDPKKNKMMADLSFDIAKHCAEHNINLDFTQLFSFVTLYDISNYLNNTIEDLDTINKDNSVVFGLLSDFVDIKTNQGSVILSVINDTAVFVFNIYFWYFLLTTDEPERLSKDAYSSEEFAEIAKSFGFNEFSTTSEKAKGKIAKTISKRLFIYEHYMRLCESIDLDSYYDNNVFNLYFESIRKIYEDYPDVLKVTSIDKDTLNTIASMDTSDEVKMTDEILQKVLNLYRIRNRLFNLYSFFQGRFDCPSLKYIQRICDKFESCHIFDINPNLRFTVNSLIEEFHSIMENYEENFQDPKVSLRAIYIQNTLFDIYKHNYIIKNKIDVLDVLKSDD